MLPPVDRQRFSNHAPANAGLTLLIIASLIFAWRLWVVPHLGITLYVDEAQYWTWAQEMDWGFFSKPPGIAALIWLSTALFGDGLLGVKVFGMLCYPLTAAVCWAIARRLYDERIAFWSALTVLTLPIFAWLGLFVSTDALLTLFWSLALLFYLRALDGQRWADWLILGLICGLGLLSKYTMAAWLGAAFLHLLAFHRPLLASPKPWLAALLALGLLAPNVLWNVQHDFPTLKHTADITLNRQTAGGWKSLGEFWGAQVIAFGPLFGLAFLALLARPWRLWQDSGSRLLFWFALPLWLIVSVQAFKSSANANWAAPSFVPAAIAVVAFWLNGRGHGLLRIAVLLNVLLAGVAYHWPLVLSAVDAEKRVKLNPFSRAQGWDELARQLRPLLAERPDALLVADNRTLLAHMRYELRDLKPRAISWNPQGVVGDHYKLTTDLRPFVGSTVIFISTSALGDEVRARFAEDALLARLWAPIIPGAEAPADTQGDKLGRLMMVHELRGFKGY